MLSWDALTNIGRASAHAGHRAISIGKAVTCDLDHSRSGNFAPFIRLSDHVRFTVLSVWLVERLHIDLCRLTGSVCH
ncbi:putative leader peptide [Nonomuraea sp. NPDC049714]|uniref:putative leader peptide n=1 Tax=Nonomuraea sp. NPDC049714 TaxID=3364357 RepID=UPI00378810E0